MIDLAGELTGVEGQQVERCRRHAGVDVVEMPVAEPDHSGHDHQIGQDGRRARRRRQNQGLAMRSGLGGVGRGQTIASLAKPANL